MQSSVGAGCRYCSLMYSTSALLTTCVVWCRYIRTDLAEQVHTWLQSAATAIRCHPCFCAAAQAEQHVLSVRLHELRWCHQQYAWEGGTFLLWSHASECHLQVLKDPENKRKVLERTPMRRIGETHEVSGAPGCQQEQLTVVLLHTQQSQRNGHRSRRL